MPTENTIEILIAEDSLTQAMRLQFALEEHGFGVKVARDGQQALDLLQSSSVALPTMVITDIEMPNLTGYELCRAIKNDPQLKDLPVMLLTSLSDPADVVKGLECRADGFVVKPYDEEFLLARIEYILHNRKMRAQNAETEGTTVFIAGEKHFLEEVP